MHLHTLGEAPQIVYPDDPEYLLRTTSLQMHTLRSKVLHSCFLIQIKSISIAESSWASLDGLATLVLTICHNISPCMQLPVRERDWVRQDEISRSKGADLPKPISLFTTQKSTDRRYDVKLEQRLQLTTNRDGDVTLFGSTGPSSSVVQHVSEQRLVSPVLTGTGNCLRPSRSCSAGGFAIREPSH
jgi:hypothetical protein